MTDEAATSADHAPLAATLPALAGPVAVDAPAVAAPAPPKRRPGGTVGNRGGQKGRSGPPGNSHAKKHGLHCRITLPNLSPEDRNVQRGCSDLRARFERECMETHGKITLSMASAINAAIAAERMARLLGKRMADGGAKMDDATMVLVMDRIAKFTESRHKLIRQVLGVESNGHGADLASFYARRSGRPVDEAPAAGQPEVPPIAPDAPTNATEALAASGQTAIQPGTEGGGA